MDDVAREEIRALKNDRDEGLIDDDDFNQLKQAAMERGTKRLNALLPQGAPQPARRPQCVPLRAANGSAWESPRRARSRPRARASQRHARGLFARNLSFLLSFSLALGG